MKSLSDTTSGHRFFHAEFKVLLVNTLPGNIINSEACHDVIVVLPELLRSELCDLCHLKIVAEQALGKEVLEI